MSSAFAHGALVGLGVVLMIPAAASCRTVPLSQSTPQPPQTVTVTVAEPSPPPTSRRSPPAPAPVQQVDNSVTIVDVVDGDTVRYAVGPQFVTARTLGIDAPEAGTCEGAEATNWAVSTLLGATVRVRYDRSQQPQDRYGRELVYLRLPDGRDYSIETAREGFATYYDVGEPVSKASAIRSAETQARSAGRGIFGPSCTARVPQTSAPPAVTTRPPTSAPETTPQELPSPSVTVPTEETTSETSGESSTAPSATDETPSTGPTP